jgi:alpha-tubulin suppressor-like RCC1 family protein
MNRIILILLLSIQTSFSQTNNSGWKSIEPWAKYGIKSNGTLWDIVHNKQIGSFDKWNNIYSRGGFFIALQEDSTLWSWGGLNEYGQLGLGYRGDNSTMRSPHQIAKDKWYSVSLGINHVFAVKSDGTLWGWGGNTAQMLVDDPHLAGKDAPFRIGSESNWTAVATSEFHTLALKTDGTLWGWGYNELGILGQGNINLHWTVPTQIGSDNDWVFISTSPTGKSYCIKKNGTLWAWGSASGDDLGLETVTKVYEPTQIGTDNDWALVSPSNFFALALKSDGSLWGWGNGGYNGIGLKFTNKPPQQIGESKDWAFVCAGNGRSVAIKSDGSAWGWPASEFGIKVDAEQRYVPTKLP